MLWQIAALLTMFLLLQKILSSPLTWLWNAFEGQTLVLSAFLPNR